MESFQLEWKSSTKKDLRKLPKEEVPKILAAAEGLITNPNPVGSKKLKGRESIYRLRVGNYRLVYEVLGDQLVILVIKVGHRKDIYKDT